MNRRYRRIKLTDILDEEQIDVSKSELSLLSERERRKIMPYIEHYILVAIRERFPDISKNSLRKRCLRIAHKEFAFAYPQ